jgi:hypothetical protein
MRRIWNQPPIDTVHREVQFFEAVWQVSASSPVVGVGPPLSVSTPMMTSPQPPNRKAKAHVLYLFRRESWTDSMILSLRRVKPLATFILSSRVRYCNVARRLPRGPPEDVIRRSSSLVLSAFAHCMSLLSASVQYTLPPAASSVTAPGALSPVVRRDGGTMVCRVEVTRP